MNKNNMGTIVNYKGEKAVVYSVNKSSIDLMYIEPLKNNVQEMVNVDPERFEVLEVNTVIDFYIEKLEKMEVELEKLELEQYELDVDNEHKIDIVCDNIEKLKMMIANSAIKRLAV